ncbi:MAG: hypothetical protein AAF066_03925 [Pseudomonadota bacterium]
MFKELWVMSVMSTPSEKTDLQQKRQDLFSLWSSNQTQESETPVVRTATVQTIPAERPQTPAPMDEVQRLIHRFADPNADRMFLD